MPASAKVVRRLNATRCRACAASCAWSRKNGLSWQSHRLLYQVNDLVSRYRFIAEEKAQDSVVVLCRALGVARSAFYSWQQHTATARAQADAHLMLEIELSTPRATARVVRRVCMRPCVNEAGVWRPNVSRV